MSIGGNKLVIRQLIEETLNKSDVDAAVDYVAESVIEFAHSPARRPVFRA